MAAVDHLSLGQARRVALAAQGFNDPLPAGRVTARHLHRVLGRTQLLQIDSVNVFARAHHMPLYSRLGPWPTGLLEEVAFRRRELFEYWAHEASYLPVQLHPLLRWRMERARTLEEGWGGMLKVFQERPGFVDGLLERVRAEGPVTAGALREQAKGKAAWWGWDDVKKGLEWLFWSGQLSTARRTTGFEKLYDVTERVVPRAVLEAPTPTREDAQRELVRLASRAHGVATERDLRDYFRLRPDEARAAVHVLVAEGALTPVQVEGWRDPAYLAGGAVLPRWVRRTTLLSPFDPLVWERARTQRLFGVDYRIEIYTPAHKRVYGYYCLLLLEDGAITARVDLKAERKAGALRVAAAWVEPGAVPGRTAEALALELRRAATWQGLGEVVVDDRGDLARALRSALRSAL
ncbi:MAG TPA: crosslink repair DNA glycosylase YcaQ family protein [Mycobacteriales bacterium]|nr:crosslink repair DNA glycosylase YcaQ family protein [Mycobacteriales bacterium]